LRFFFALFAVKPSSIFFCEPIQKNVANLCVFSLRSLRLNPLQIFFCEPIQKNVASLCAFSLRSLRLNPNVNK